jgi:hypothetical protein
MLDHQPKQFRILAVALSTRGFGFVVMEGQKTLIEWGGKVAKGDKNVQSHANVEKLVEFYQPAVLVLQDVTAKGSRRAPRIKALNQQIIKSARNRKLKVALFSRKELLSVILGDVKGTKHEMAKVIAGRFSEELASRLPPKRRPWTSEDSRMDIFDAVALALIFRRATKKRTR